MRLRLHLLLLGPLFAASSALVACGGAVASPDAPEQTSPTPISPAPKVVPPVASAPPPSTTSPTPAPPPPSTSPHPTPSPYAWMGRDEGCGDIVLYDVSLSGQRLLIVTIDRKSLGLTKAGDSATVNLATQPGVASVRLDQYAQGLTTIPVCNDVGIAQKPFSSVQAVSGTVILTLESAPGPPGQNFVVSARTSGVHIVNEKGADEVVQDDQFDHVTVGWFAG